nr:PREDICTED: uncharacterized protein LOC100881378 isoform X1 [Megachile rotundata]
MEGNITLILNENRIEVIKEKLASRSCYFASLFSHNFNDSHSNEHVINYNVTFCTLQNFVEWIHDDETPVYMHYSPVKVSMIKFIKNNFTELLSLLQLSLLFMADDLTNDVTDIIISHWLLPEKIIDIWLLAQELSIKALQDICLSICLDRFEELPVHSLTELTKDNITRLITNVNIRSSTEYLKFVRDEWKMYHGTTDIAEIKDKSQLKFIRGSVVCNTQESVVKDIFLYTWNGDNLSKCVRLKNIGDSGNLIIGMQIAGRGFNIYTIGGEMGLGTGKFNDIIWRYCLLSKKWYYQARLPVPRRHMVAVFLKDKLVVVGGVGRHRLKLLTVDILHIHTGNWTKSASIIPESFTEVPPYCVLNGKLFLLKSSLYIYSVETNYWDTIAINNPAIRSIAFLTPDTTLFLIGDHSGETILSKIDIKETVCQEESCTKECARHNIINIMNIAHEDYYRIRYARVIDIDMIILDNDRDEKYQYLHVHRQVRKDFENLSIPKLGCINIIDPATLYDTV